ncbi:hypothetical protein H5V43_23385 (plasmid) [Sphingobium fuliginis]|jgi:hypothetical protein|uniref:Uncharacterized protein n=1 Tax=Sphingobium fuliginis (strain ATCC 27551) TaxID=336203 RepID=A0A7M2GQQ7_SPHSA|nr:DUF6118 family protein [Sphingobium fuliginis]QOT74665.1 hypothetical protein H5V43_23385 [Sphingobium fuliginis]
MTDDNDYRDEPQDDPAAAFERLRGEVSLLRSAIEGLTAARESIDIPDYEPTLARTEKVLTVLAEQFGLMRQSPAMTLTPENMGARLNAAVAESVNTLRSHAQASKSALDGTVNELRAIVRSARHADDQDRRVYLFGGGGLVLGLLLYAVMAGPIARLAPASWQWPEKVATRVLAERTPWDAGQHLMQTAAPESWGVIVAAAPLADGNREAIDGCREQAAEARKAVRCTIDVKADDKP